MRACVLLRWRCVWLLLCWEHTQSGSMEVSAAGYGLRHAIHTLRHNCGHMLKLASSRVESVSAPCSVGSS